MPTSQELETPVETRPAASFPGLEEAIDLGRLIDEAQAAQGSVVTEGRASDPVDFAAAGPEAAWPAESELAVSPERLVARSGAALEPQLAALLARVPEARLYQRWDETWRTAFQWEAAREVPAESSLQAAIQNYLNRIPANSEPWRRFIDAARSDAVGGMIETLVPVVLAGLYGTQDVAFGGGDGRSAEDRIGSLLRRHEADPEGSPLPTTVHAGLQLAVPGAIAAAADLYFTRADSAEHARAEPYEIAVALARQLPRLRANAVMFAQRGTVSGEPVSLAQMIASQPEQLREIARSSRLPGVRLNQAALRYLSRLASGVSGSDPSYEIFLLEHAYGGGRESNRAEHVTFGDAFGHFTELKELSAMDAGLALPHRVPLAVELFQPYLMFRRDFQLSSPRLSDPGRASDPRKATFLETVYGLNRATMKTLQQVLLGEALVVGLTPAGAREFFEAQVVPCCQRGELLDSSYGGDQPVQRLLAFVRTPKVRGGRACDAVAEMQAAAAEHGEAGAVTGPRGLKLLLEALGADREALGPLLLRQHAQFVAAKAARGLRPRANAGGAALTAAPERRELIEGLLRDRTVLDCVTMRNLPVLRTPGLRPGETLEEDADGLFRLQRSLAERALKLQKDYADPAKIPDSVVAELQTAFGYYTLGPEIYRGLPMERSLPVPDRLTAGIAESLEGKHGMLRSTLYGTRFDNSARLKILPDPNQPLDMLTIPPRTMAIVRGDYLVAALNAKERTAPPAGSDREQFERQLVKRLLKVYGRQSKSTDLLADLRKEMQGWRRKLALEIGPQSGELLDAELRAFMARLPQPHAAEMMRVFHPELEVAGLGVSGARQVGQYLAKALLDHPWVKTELDQINEFYPALTSRFPVIHCHSYVTLRVRMGPPEAEALFLHPLVCAGLNADFDGDGGDPWFPLPYGHTVEQAKAWRHMMDEHSPLRALLNSGNGTDFMFRLNNNAAEGLAKANVLVFPALAPGDALDGETVRQLIREALGPRDALLAAMRNEPTTLLQRQGQVLAKLAAMLGTDVVWTGRLVRASDPQDNERYTTVSRLFLHEAVGLVASPEEAAGVLGPLYLRQGEAGLTRESALEKLLVNRCAPTDAAQRSSQPGDHIGAVFQSFFSYLAAEAATAGQSARPGGLTTYQTMEWLNGQPFLAALRANFEERMIAVEMGRTAGILTPGMAQSVLLRLEAGERPIDEAAFGQLLTAYRGASPEQRPAAATEIEEFLTAASNDPSIGLKPLAKAAMRYGVDQFALEFGHPHIVVEQLFTTKVKAKDEVLYRFFMGTANIVDGEMVPTTPGGLVGGSTVERILKSGVPALDKATKSKTEVKDPGVAFKEYEQALSGVYITAKTDRPDPSPTNDPWAGKTRDFKIADFLGSHARLGYLVHQLKVRRLRVSQVPGEAGARFTAALQEAVEAVPFEGKPVERLLRDLAREAPEALVQVRSVLFDRATGLGVSAEAAGYHPTGGPDGLGWTAGGSIRRIPFTDGPCLGYPIGALWAGSTGQLASQAALRLRHVTGSSISEFSHLGDWHKVVHGPFPQRSPYYRAGGDRIQSASPLGHAGFETFRTAFTAEAVGAADQALTKVRRVTTVAGVEVFPGESYRIAGGKLVVGTNRPELWTASVDPAWFAFKAAAAAPAGTEPVFPVKFRVRLSGDEASRINCKLADTVAAFDPAVAPGVSALRLGSAVLLSVETARNALPALQARLGWSDEQLRARIEVDPEAEFKRIGAAELARQWPALNQQGLGFLRVVGQPWSPPDGGGVPLPAGSLIDPREGLALRNLGGEMSQSIEGFAAFIGFLSGKQLAERAPLALHGGLVTEVVCHGIKAEACDYRVTLKVPAQGNTPEKTVTQLFQLGVGDAVCVQPGQTIEAGRPLGFGAVDLAERSAIRGAGSKVELADYLTAYFYTGEQGSLLPVGLELLSRALFPGDKYTPVDELHLAPDNRVGVSAWQKVGRSGHLKHLAVAAYAPNFGPGFGHAFTMASAEDNARRREVVVPAHLTRSPHAQQFQHASAPAENLGALGFKTAILQPLEAAAERSRQPKKPAGVESVIPLGPDLA